MSQDELNKSKIPDAEKALLENKAGISRANRPAKRSLSAYTLPRTWEFFEVT